MNSPVQSSPLFPEPRWAPPVRLQRTNLPASPKSWLLDTGSLTQRLRQTCQDQFKVRLLDQGWARPLPNEARLLGLSSWSYVWIREVQLFCGQQPWVFARTLIPPLTLRSHRYLTRLGTRPLGEILFTDPRAERGAVEVARIASGQRLHRRAFGHAVEAPNVIWGRRSLFRIDNRPLLVCEIFLQDLPGLPVGKRHQVKPL